MLIKKLQYFYIGLLEDFKHKSYTVKQMEILFENWRRKVEIPPFEMKQNKPKKSFLKMFKPKENESTKAKTNIQQTKNSKKFTKDGKGKFIFYFVKLFHFFFQYDYKTNVH